MSIADHFANEPFGIFANSVTEAARSRPLRNDLGAQSVGAAESSAILRSLALLAVILVIVGLVIGYLKPGPVTGLLLPVGLTLWLGIGYVAAQTDTATYRR